MAEIQNRRTTQRELLTLTFAFKITIVSSALHMRARKIIPMIPILALARLSFLFIVFLISKSFLCFKWNVSRGRSLEIAGVTEEGTTVYLLCLLLFYTLVTSKVISGQELTSDSVHSWQLYSAATLRNQAISTMTHSSPIIANQSLPYPNNAERLARKRQVSIW